MNASDLKTGAAAGDIARMSLPAHTALLLGIEIIFTSLFFSSLGHVRADNTAAEDIASARELP